MTDLSDKVALVTGASRGLGFAAAEALGAAGAHVIAVARTAGGLAELDDRIRAAGGRATLAPLDITDDPGLERLGAAIFERWGRVDVWLHTAVHTPGQAPVEHIQDTDLDRTIAINFRAVQRLIRVIDPLLRQAPSGKALFARDETVSGRPYHAGYRSLLRARDDLVADWSNGLARTSRVRVVTLAPPPMRTAVRARLYPGEEIARPNEIADVAARLVEIAADASPDPDPDPRGAVMPVDVRGAARDRAP